MSPWGHGVDFVVVGFGFGALSVLLGLLLRDLVPWWFRVAADRPLPETVARRRVAHRRAGRAGGGSLAIAGAFLGLITLVTLLGNAGDRTGMEVVFAALTVALLALLAWGFTYAQRFHSRPWVHRSTLPRRLADGGRPIPEETPALSSPAPSRWAAFEMGMSHSGDDVPADAPARSGHTVSDSSARVETESPVAGEPVEDSPPEPAADPVVADRDGTAGGHDATADTANPRRRRDIPIRANAAGGS